MRGLVVDDRRRVVLVRFDGVVDGTFWTAPGGGIEDGEDDATALARELREELGLELTEPLGSPVWTRTHEFRLPMSRWDGQSDRFYLVRVPAFDIRPMMSQAALEAEGVREIRWWSPADLERAVDVVFAPRRLPQLLAELLDHGPSIEALDVGI